MNALLPRKRGEGRVLELLGFSGKILAKYPTNSKEVTRRINDYGEDNRTDPGDEAVFGREGEGPRCPASVPYG